MKKKDTAKPGAGGRRIDWEEYSRLCQLIAKRVKAERDPDTVVGIAKGGVIVGATVASLLEKDFYPIKFSRRVNEKVVRKRPKLIVPPTIHLEGKKVLLVDDMSATGETMRAAAREIQGHGPKDITTAVLVRREKFSPDYYATYSRGKVTFPWQMEGEDSSFEDGEMPK